MIFGAFLWASVTYLVPVVSLGETPEAPLLPTRAGLQIPCEREGGKVFVSPDDVAFVRADGHYTQIYTQDDRLFCAWPITEASKRLLPAGFLKTHRSYLVNPLKVSRFERAKDKGRCVFGSAKLPPAPVSRSKLKEVQAILHA